MNKIIKYMKHPSNILLYLMNENFFKWIPDKKYIKIKYKLEMNKKLNLQNSQTFNEKLQWLKLYDRNPAYTKMVDKYEAKKYVADIIGKEYIIPTLGVWENFGDIDFSKLPNQFVLKCTHDSGGLVICRDKSKLNMKDARRKINKSLKRNYFYSGREWPYKNVKPRIIVEKYMVDESKTELKDYKIFNFNGIPQFVQVDFNRFKDHQRKLYSINWKELDFNFVYPINKKVKINRPENLKKILELAKKIAKDHPFLRTDFYVINDKIYFGEITFFPEAGFGKFVPEKWDRKLGDMLELPKEKKIEK